MMQEHFFKPWAEIDPELKSGGIAGELAPYFVGPDLGDNARTKSDTLRSIFTVVRDVTQSISMHPSSMREGAPDRRIVEESLSGLNAIFERIVDETHTDATRFFDWTHAIPPYSNFALAPIRYPLRMEFARRFVFRGLGTLVEVAELNRNAAHTGLRPQDADVIIAPLYDLKAWIIKHLFDLEVAGEISRAELQQLFSGKYRPGPIVSIPDASADRSDAAASADALSGVDVLQWFPAQTDWDVFGKLAMDRYSTERIHQPEGAIPTTEDVAYEQKVLATDGASVIGNNSQP